MMAKLDEIESRVNAFYEKTGTNVLSINLEKNGLVHIQADVEKWYVVLNTKFCNIDRDLQFSVDKPLPFIMMFFQLKGVSTFISGSTTKVASRMHSLNNLPEFKFTSYLERGASEEYFCVKIFPELLLQHLGETNETNPLVEFCKKNQHFVTLNRPQVISPIIYQAINDYLNCPYKGALGKVYKENIILNLFIHQLGVFSAPEQEADTVANKFSKKDTDLLNDIRIYLDKHYLEVTSLQQLTRKFYINSFKLKYGFKHLFNSSVMKYVDEHKMNYAHTMLQQQQIPVNDIADELGYQHYNNFSTAFKKRFGYSPALVKT
jgi:AraC-like DNA-binding protein